MNKKIIAAAVAATFAAPVAMADSNVTVYGKIRQAVEMDDMGNNLTTPTAQGSRVLIKDYASRLGFKGSEDLGNGLKAIFQMEFQLDLTNDKQDSNEFSGGSFGSGRNTFVGLAGDFGTVLIGRHDHPVKMSTGSLDYFADTAGDYNNGYGGSIVDLRADGAIAYVSPNFSGLTFIGAVVPGEDEGASVPSNNDDGLADAYSVALTYSNAGIFASVGYEQADSGIDFPLLTTNNFADYEQVRVGLGYTMDAFAVNVVWANVQVDDPTTAVTDFDQDTLIVSGKYSFGNNAIMAKWFDTDESASGLQNDVDGWALGFAHNFSKRTQAEVVYVSSDGGINAQTHDGDILSLQLNHNF